MNQINMRNNNMLTIFDQLNLNGELNIEELMEKTGLSHVTIRKIGNLLCDKKILRSFTKDDGKIGRKSQYFVISNRPYSVYMFEDRYSYIIIGLNAYSNVIVRHDYVKRGNATYLENFKNAILSITSRPEYLYCLQIYGNCFEESEKNFPDFIKRIRLKRFITENMCSPDEMVIVEFHDECYLSAYGRIHNNKAEKDVLLKALNCDRVISYKDYILDGLIDALQYTNLKIMRNNIMELKK